MQSTDYYRTIQSGYSELLGFHQDQNYSQISFPQFQELDNPSEIQTLPFNVRNTSQLNTDLGLKAAPDGFLKDAIYGYIDKPTF